MKRILLVVTLLAALSASAFAQKNDSTCAAFPCVVASVSLTGQSQPVTAVPLLTPTTDGLYRITYYFEATGTNSNWKLRLAWKDDVATQSYPTSVANNSKYMASSSSVTVTARDLSGQPLAYTVQQFAGGTYNLYITVEQLQ